MGVASDDQAPEVPEQVPVAAAVAEAAAAAAAAAEEASPSGVSGVPEKHHLIDGDLDYKGFGNFLPENGLQGRGEDYSVLAVFGGQSSGKSTLLNRLFGTRFQEMDSTHGRGQTTQGVWMSKASESDRLVVLDFEGTDSAERGEDQTFEKKLSTFALAMADILMINLFQFEIGRRNAMSVPLLEKVLQINFDIQLQLADSKASSSGSKKMLLFVVRDYDGRTPVEVLSSQLIDIMESVWSKIVRPDGHEEDKLTKWFDFKVVTVPHLMMPNPELDTAVEKLREVFLQEDNSEFVFKQTDGVWRSSGVPVTDLDRYSSVCWGAIKENKEINIPGEKELVARHRSTEIAHALRTKFNQTSQEMTGRLLDRGAVPGVHTTLLDALCEAMRAFEKETHMFHRYANVLEEERKELEEQLRNTMGNTMDILYDKIVNDLASEMRTALSEATVKVKGSFDFTPSFFWDFLKREVANVKEQTTLPKLDEYVASAVLDEDGRRTCEAKVEEMTRSVVLDFVKGKAAGMGDLMADRFLYVLTHSDSGNVRTQKESELDDRCPEAYNRALQVLEALSVWRLDGLHSNLTYRYPQYTELNNSGDGDAVSIANADLLAEDLLVTQTKLNNAYTRFCAQMKGKVLEARLSLEREVNLPPWVYLVFVVLGFNEAIWLLSNPLFIITLLFLLFFFAKTLVRKWYVDAMENGPIPLRAALVAGWPYIQQLLDAAPESGDAPKSHDAKKND
eukprot:TRINITY_DN16341_c0_g1_i1.p1 TRINITY_DN16341_c0_g1~~TRINITY_DN16341_c0_g1_i1.p1  ORF type:complete len:745 (+),score=365.76 TRINITY_DN16341_c0_g1_i1:37-2235(+)